MASHKQQLLFLLMGSNHLKKETKPAKPNKNRQTNKQKSQKHHHPVHYTTITFLGTSQNYYSAFWFHQIISWHKNGNQNEIILRTPYKQSSPTLMLNFSDRKIKKLSSILILILCSFSCLKTSAKMTTSEYLILNFIIKADTIVLEGFLRKQRGYFSLDGDAWRVK